MKKKKSSTKKRTINLGSNYIKFLTAVDKYRHLPYDQYKKKIAQELNLEKTK
jgi:hypothetical protein|tara:strand:+ start:65 stop:220 length:156 start_codon:yes stop_codon:yes gene_type:complete